MKRNFWSIVFVLDDDFLKGKFIEMVNGGGIQFKEPGWHGMYVFEKELPFKPLPNNRIYPIDLDMKTFRQHAINAATFWKKERVQLRPDWTAEKRLR